MYEEYLHQLEIEGELRNRTPKTIRTYKSNISMLLRFTGKHPDDLDFNDARNFILDKKRAGVGAQCCNTYNSAFRFFYKNVLHKGWDLEIVPRMKIDISIPDVLTLEEVERMIDAAEDIRYKAIIAVMYSGGLRVSEVAELRYEDVSRSTMQIHIRRTKNHADYHTIISQRAMDLLTEYWHAYGRPRDYLFIGKRAPHNPLKTGGIESAIRQIGKDAGIKKRVYPHLLRHSFATHMIEAGVDPLYVQSMLGHRCFESTNVYIHIANKTIMGVKSPLDHPKKSKTKGKKKG